MDSFEYKHLSPVFEVKVKQIELLAAKILRFLPSVESTDKCRIK